MKAIVCEAYGPVDGLKYLDVETPEPGPYDCLVEAEAIGVNFPDGLLVQGLYQAKPPTPFVPGMEVVGRIVKAGEKVTGFSAGDRVAGLVMIGGYAEKVVVPASGLVRISEKLDAGEVSALICGYGTAYHALRQRADLQSGEALVVTGGSGLTGLAAIQLGKAMGARVVAAASSEEKRAVSVEHGADIAISYDDLKNEIKKHTGGEGADVIFEVVGGDVFDACSRAVAWAGRLLVIGFASGTIPQFPVNLALVKGYSLVGVFWGSFTGREPDRQAENMRQLLDWYESGEIRPLVSKRYQLADAVSALRSIQKREVTGKVVLVP